MAYILVVKLLERSMTRRHISLMLKKAVPILLMAHTSCISANLSGAAKQFNYDLMQVFTYNLFEVSKLVNFIVGKETG